MNLKDDFLYVIKKNKIIFIIGIIATVSEMALSFGIPYINKDIIDDGIISKNYTVLLYLCILLGVMHLAQYLSTMLGAYSFTKLSKEYTTKIYMSIIDRMMKKNYFFFINNSAGEIIQRISETWQLEEVFSIDFFQAFLSLISFFIAIIILIRISVKMVMLSLGISMVIFIVYYYGSDILERLLPIVLDRNIVLTSQLEEILHGILEIRTNNAQRLFEKNIYDTAEKKLKDNLKLAVYPSFFFNATTTISSLLLVAILFISGTDIINGTLTVGSYMMIASYVQMIINPTMQIGYLINTLKPVIIIVKRLNETFGKSELKDTYEVGIQSDDISILELTNVTFGYDNKYNIFENISFKMKRGEVLLLRGANGSGKTTLLNILCGEINDYQGDICTDISGVTCSNNVSFAHQRPYIFRKSIRDNIVLAREYDKKKYSELIEELNFKNYFDDDMLDDDYILEENGKNLSGGQTKLLSFARCMYQDKRIIILDEVASNMDANMRKNIKEYINRIRDNHFVILVEHSDLYDDIADICIDLK